MPYTFQQAQLDNGLTIIGESDPAAHTASCGFFVKTGARDEDSPVMGVSHFLEHMMFKGTARRSAEDVNRQFDELGASHNAYTSSEMTVFYGTVLPDRLAAMTELLADIMRPALRQQDFDLEKNVILEEIAMYRDQPFWVLYERVMEDYYAQHPLAHRVLGTADTITALERAQMQGYFDHRYSADNTTVALAGAVDFGGAVEQIQNFCGHWQRTGARRDAAAPAPTPGELKIEDENVSRAYMLLVTPGPAAQDDRRYAAALLASILGDAGNSRLHWALIETGLAEEAMAAFDARDGCGDYYVYASGDPGRTDDIWAVVEQEIAGLIDSISDDDLERLRNKMATGVTLAGERPSGRMQRLGRRWTYLPEYSSLEEELERIQAVSLEDLRNVWRDFPFARRTVGRLVPK